ncbi:MAG: hypothetical protein HKN03_00575 [Acidimicrobiales bacterium]|nr:hypothetical protein [Acidimicrobiales bacterium]
MNRPGGAGGEIVNRPGGAGELWRRLRGVDNAEAVSLSLAAVALFVVWPEAVLGRGLLLTIGFALLAVLLVAVGVPLVLRTVSVALVVMVIVVSSTDGGLRIHGVAPLVFLAIAAVSSLGRPSLRRLFSLLAGAVGVGLVSLLLGDWVLSPRSPSAEGPGSLPGDAPRDSSADGLWQRLSEFFGLDSGGEGTPGDLNPLPASPPPDDSSLSWWLILLVVAVLIGLALLLRLFFRRRGTHQLVGSKWSLIERFERVGAKAGAVREPSQGLVSYGEAFPDPADPRPRATGEAISSALFHPGVEDPSHAERLLKDLEGLPPARRKRGNDPTREQGLSD